MSKVHGFMSYLVGIFATTKNGIKLLIIFRHLQIVFQTPVMKKNREPFVLQLSLKTNI